MAGFLLKRTLTNVTECFVRLYGPYNGTDRAPGFSVQPQDFDKSNDTVADANLEPLGVYEAVVTLFGDREGTAKFEIQPSDLSKPYQKVGELKVPKNAKKRSPSFGYVYTTSIQFTIPA